MINLTDLDLTHKRILIREDFNVPIDANGAIVNDQRLQATLPTIRYVLEQKAKVILISHLGRPKEKEAIYSLKTVAQKLSELLGVPVRLAPNWLNQPLEIQAGEIVLCENIRFEPGETANDIALAQKLASMCDVFVMDAFAVAHRKHASTYGVAQLAKTKCAGFLLLKEIEALKKIMEQPAPPLLAIVGGAKVTTKLKLLANLSEKVDHLIVGGGIANTFLLAGGYKIGKSLCELEMVKIAEKLLATEKVPLPIDVAVSKTFDANAQAIYRSIADIEPDDYILDIGPKTVTLYQDIINKSKTILWNGPLGVIEFPHFAQGTQQVAEAITNSSAFSVAGGGDTLSAIEQFNLTKPFSYLSTGGGAFLKYIEGETLPGIAALE